MRSYRFILCRIVAAQNRCTLCTSRGRDVKVRWTLVPRELTRRPPLPPSRPRPKAVWPAIFKHAHRMLDSANRPHPSLVWIPKHSSPASSGHHNAHIDTVEADSRSKGSRVSEQQPGADTSQPSRFAMDNLLGEITGGEPVSLDRSKGSSSAAAVSSPPPPPPPPWLILLVCRSAHLIRPRTPLALPPAPCPTLARASSCRDSKSSK